MFASPSTIAAMTRRCAALIFVLWLAGVGCFVGCEMNVAAAPKHESQTASQTESCPAFSGHDCCQKTEESNDAASIAFPPKKTENISCCPLTALSADAARRVSTSDAPFAAVQSTSQVVPDTRISIQLPASRLKVPDRGSTYLRYCVFLI